MMNQLMILNPGPKKVTRAWLRKFAMAFRKAVGRQPNEDEMQRAIAQRKVGASIRQSLLLTRPHIGQRPFQGNPSSDWHERQLKRAMRQMKRAREAGLVASGHFYEGYARAHRDSIKGMEEMEVENPGAGWHFDEAGEAMALSAEYPYGSPEARYHLGRYDAHVHSEMESRRKKMNPSGYGRRWIVTVELGEGSLLGTSNRAFSKKKEAAYFAKRIVAAGAPSAEVKDLKSARWWKWARGPRGAIKIIDSFDKRMRATDPRRGRKNPCGTTKRRPKKRRRKKRAGNPTAGEGYMGFHGKFPTRERTVKVPDGFPKRMWLLGKLHRLILTDGSHLSGGYVAAGSGNAIYLLNVRKNLPKGGRVAQIEYTPKKPSDKHGATYFHTYKTPPRLTKKAKGFYIIRGARQKLTSRGIIG